MFRLRLLFSITLLLLAACGGGSASPAASAPPATASQLSQAADLGRQIFSDVSLSASGKQSCANCHDPANGHSPSNALPVQFGGPDGTTPGFRAAPSLRYLERNTAFFFAPDGTPTGGFDRDGRAATLADQAGVPLLAAHEMANADAAAVIARLRKASYAGQFQQVFGAGIFDTPDAAFSRITYALQQYQKEDPAFHPYDSKYDLFLAGKASLSAQELRGLSLFNDPVKGNCAACHPSARGSDGSAPLFTDFSFDNLGVPRNKGIPATADPAYYDLGICGPDRTDLATRTDLCGAFRVPSLRNIVLRKSFFHNGAFTTLSDALHFYVERDTDPAKWYPVAADGTVDKFNDLPPAYRKNVNTLEVPYNRTIGMAPALSDDEINDVISFLGTLTDGYKAAP